MLCAPEAARHDPRGRPVVVRHGSLPERAGQTGLGAVRVKVPRVRERRGRGMRWPSARLPPARRQAKSLDALLPWLSRNGVSPGDVSAAGPARWGPEAPGLSPATIRRLPQGGHAALTPGPGRSRTGTRAGAFWVDGVSCEPRRAAARQGMLGLLGADARGPKERVGLGDGDRERAPSWTALLLDLTSRGVEHGPALARGAGALGVWQALRPVDGQPRWQRGGVQKTATGLAKLPQDLQAQAQQCLQALWMAPDRPRAAVAVELCSATYEAQ